MARILFAMGAFLCALPLAAQTPAAVAHRVLAPCELTTASLGPSGQESPTQGRGFNIHIMNGSPMTVDLSAYPEFGWRVEIKRKHGWRLKAQGGPVRRIGSPDNPHLLVVGGTGNGPMVHLAPGFARDYRFFLPGADRALRPGGGLTYLRLSVYWAATGEMKRDDPAALNCAITANWTISMLPNKR